MKYETTNFIKKITKSHPVLNLDNIVYFQFNDQHNHKEEMVICYTEHIHLILSNPGLIS